MTVPFLLEAGHFQIKLCYSEKIKHTIDYDLDLISRILTAQ